jgi:hypothetical protein
LNSSVELTLAGDGISIERQGESDSVYSNFIRPSRAIAQWVMPDQNTLDDFVGIQTEAETAWAMLIYRNDSLIHVGRVLADQMTRLRESIQSKPIIDLVAVDGLELMDGYKVQSSWFSDEYITINQLFRRCLDTLDLSDYWVVNGTPQQYLYDGTLLNEDSAARLGFDMYKLFEYTFLENFDPFTDVKVIDTVGWQIEPNYISAKQALENVLLMFGARFTHENGAYYVIPFNAYNNTTSINLREYSYTGQYIGTTTYSHRQTIGNDVRPLWMAKPSLYYQPAAQSVTINTHRQNVAKALRSYPNTSSSTLSLIATDIPTGTSPDAAPMRIRFMAKSFKRSDTLVWGVVCRRFNRCLLQYKVAKFGWLLCLFRRKWILVRIGHCHGSIVSHANQRHQRRLDYIGIRIVGDNRAGRLHPIGNQHVCSWCYSFLFGRWQMEKRQFSVEGFLGFNSGFICRCVTISKCGLYF